MFEEINFSSKTVRAFKLNDMEARCEDYGQTVKYNGGIKGAEDVFQLDNSHAFPKGKEVRVCGNTASMIQDTRYNRFFDVTEKGEHLGLFDCSNGEVIKEKACVGCC